MGRQPVPMTYPAEWLMDIFGGKPQPRPYQARIDTGNARLLRRVELAGYWMMAFALPAITWTAWAAICWLCVR